MDTEESTIIRNIQKKMTLFYPEQIYTIKDIEDGIEKGEILADRKLLLPYIQTALFDEKIIEVEIDGTTRVYFSRITDDLPDLEEEEDGNNIIMVEPEYTPGDYLRAMTHIISLPLEPGMGNLHIRNSQHVLFRVFTSTSAMEIGVLFEDLVVVRDIPMLRLSFPLIGRHVRGARAFRAKVPVDFAIEITIKGKRKQKDLISRPIDVSAQGMAIIIEKKEMELFRLEEKRLLTVSLPGKKPIKVTSKVRHLSKVRGKSTIQYMCGVQFDLETRGIAASIESIVATVQRAHLKELSDKSEETGIDLIK